MGERTWGEFDVPTADDYQEDLQEQVEIRCTNTTRGAPWLNKRIYETNTKLRWSYDGAEWVLIPASAPRYRDGVTLTASAYEINSTTEHSINGSIFDWTAPPGNVAYELRADFRMIGSVDGDTFAFNVNMDGDHILNEQRDIWIHTAGQLIPVKFDVRIQPPAGPHHFSVVAARGAGTGGAKIPDGGQVGLWEVGTY